MRILCRRVTWRGFVGPLSLGQWPKRKKTRQGAGSLNLRLLGKYQKMLEDSQLGCLCIIRLSHLLAPPLAFGQRPAITARSIHAVSSCNGSGSQTGRLILGPEGPVTNTTQDGIIAVMSMGYTTHFRTLMLRRLPAERQKRTKTGSSFWPSKGEGTCPVHQVRP